MQEWIGFFFNAKPVHPEMQTLEKSPTLEFYKCSFFNEHLQRLKYVFILILGGLKVQYCAAP